MLVPSRLGSARPARSLARSLILAYPVLFDVLHNSYSSHACTQFTVGVYLLFEMIDVCTLMVLLSGADLISLDTIMIASPIDNIH